MNLALNPELDENGQFTWATFCAKATYRRQAGWTDDDIVDQARVELSEPPTDEMWAELFSALDGV